MDTPHSDPALSINPFGHKLKSLIPGFGSDVSSQVTSLFESEMLQYAEQQQLISRKERVALDLISGCCAANAYHLAQLGYVAYAVDFSPHDPSLDQVIGYPLVSGGVLLYLRRDVRQISFSFLQRKLELVTCQKGIHFLRFNESRKLLIELDDQLLAGGRMYFSIGAMDCKVGGDYKHSNLPIADRWHPLEPEFGEPIGVTEPLCLYRREDIDSLFAGLNGQIVRVEQDDFGLYLVEFRKS